MLLWLFISLIIHLTDPISHGLLNLLIIRLTDYSSHWFIIRLTDYSSLIIHLTDY
jgi:hypothetical protein